MSATTPQNHPSFEELFKDVDTVPLALFEHLDLSFLEEFSVFAPDPWGRTRKHGAPELFKGVLYCFSRDIYGVKGSPENFTMNCSGDSVGPIVLRPTSRFIGSSRISR